VTKAEIKRVAKLLTTIEATKNCIAGERDKLRRHVDDLNDLLETLDHGLDSVEDGLHNIQAGVDQMSGLI
jgi:ABC-type transporter Mla subunit MlaD